MAEEDSITIKIHGTPANRQRIIDEFCRFAVELVEKFYQEKLEVRDWGWTLESSREPSDG